MVLMAPHVVFYIIYVVLEELLGTPPPHGSMGPSVGPTPLWKGGEDLQVYLIISHSEELLGTPGDVCRPLEVVWPLHGI